MGCDSVSVTATKMRGRGAVTTEDPAPGNGWRGGVHIADWDEAACDACGGQCAAGCAGFDSSMERFGGAAVYDLRVSLQCNGFERSMPQTPVRLSCAHNYGTQSCHMGRIEVFNPAALHVGSQTRGSWGSVCGHYFVRPSRFPRFDERGDRNPRCVAISGTTTTWPISSAASLGIIQARSTLLGIRPR